MNDSGAEKEAAAGRFSQQSFRREEVCLIILQIEKVQTPISAVL